ncbi:hypothetical protein T439DRAFT_379255, partial [Meredithblackwellia eburnea MCA 4105]
MNAHHKKKSYRPEPPSQASFVSSGSFGVPIPSKASKQSDEVEDGIIQNKTPSETSETLWKRTKRQPFGSQLDLILTFPNGSNSRLPSEVSTIVQSSTTYAHCPGVNLADLLTPAFLDAYIRKGSLVGLSVGSRPGEDIVCIDGRGRMVLSLSKEVYEVLGFPGRPSAFDKSGQRFVVEIDMREPSFRSGKPNFARTERLLRNWPAKVDLFDELLGPARPVDNSYGRTFDMMFSFASENGEPTSINFPLSIKPTFNNIEETSQILKSASIPVVTPLLDEPNQLRATKRARVGNTHLSGQQERETTESWILGLEEVHYWLGLASLESDENVTGPDGEFWSWADDQASAEEEEDFLDEDPEMEDERILEVERGDVYHYSWTGLLHSAAVLNAVQKIADSLAGPTPPKFASLSLKSFPHSPVTHLTSKQTVATRKRPNGKKRKRGRGRGEEDEADLSKEGRETG